MKVSFPQYATISPDPDGGPRFFGIYANEKAARKDAAEHASVLGVPVGLFSLIDMAVPAGVVWKGAAQPNKAKASEPKRRWTPEEDAALFNYTAEAGNMTMTELCKALNRTERAVKARMKAIRG